MNISSRDQGGSKQDLNVKIKSAAKEDPHRRPVAFHAKEIQPPGEKIVEQSRMRNEDKVKTCAVSKGSKEHFDYKSRKTTSTIKKKKRYSRPGKFSISFPSNKSNFSNQITHRTLILRGRIPNQCQPRILPR
ncbi:hypothetical protein Droror1_Dr00025960 [Drosera rotundifolia]